jgi:hypothetical protein
MRADNFCQKQCTQPTAKGTAEKAWKYAHTVYRLCANCKQPHSKNRIEKRLLRFCFRKFFSSRRLLRRVFHSQNLHGARLVQHAIEHDIIPMGNQLAHIVRQAGAPGVAQLRVCCARGKILSRSSWPKLRALAGLSLLMYRTIARKSSWAFGRHSMRQGVFAFAIDQPAALKRASFWPAFVRLPKRQCRRPSRP